MTKRVIFVLTSHDQLGDTGKKTGWHLSEVSHPYKILKNAGCDITFASPDGGPAPMDPSSKDLNDPINREFVEDPMVQAALQNTLAGEEIVASGVDGIYFAGGHGTMWDLPHSPHLAAATAAIYDAGGVVGAICHGPAGLLNARLKNGNLLIDGKDLTSFSDAEERGMELDNVVPFLLESELKSRGGRYSCASPGEEKVIVSERLVTGQNPASADGLGKRILELLTTVKSSSKHTEAAI
jgi:putative intracellular protease/amidase